VVLPTRRWCVVRSGRTSHARAVHSSGSQAERITAARGRGSRILFARSANEHRRNSVDGVPMRRSAWSNAGSGSSGARADGNVGWDHWHTRHTRTTRRERITALLCADRVPSASCGVCPRENTRTEPFDDLACSLVGTRQSRVALRPEGRLLHRASITGEHLDVPRLGAQEEEVEPTYDPTEQHCAAAKRCVSLHSGRCSSYPVRRSARSFDCVFARKSERTHDRHSGIRPNGRIPTAARHAPDRALCARAAAA
jgi:hypothetical protein